MRPDRQRMEERLDEALKRYGEVEPRSGLERRVFARLQAERAKSAGNRWWLPVTAAAAGIAAIGGAVVLGVRPDHAPVRSKIVATKNNPALAGGARPGLDPQIQARVTPRPRTRRAAVIPDPHAAERRDRTAPRLDRFPSPMPLSEQEQLLADYVQDFGREATLLARAQTQLREEETRERTRLAAGAGTSQDTSKEQP
jgi:hypothetical protein